MHAFTNVVQAARSLRAGSDGASVGRQLEALRALVPGRLGEILGVAAEMLTGGADPTIEPATVAAMVLVALDGVCGALSGQPLDEDSIDAHLNGLRSLAPIPGFELGAAEEEPALPFERPSADLVEAFQTEARELLETCERSLLALETDVGDKNAVQELFRALHSFKGNCGFLGMHDMEQLAHRTESLLVLLKEGRRGIDLAATSALLGAVDALRQAVERAAEGGPVAGLPGLLRHLEDLLRNPGEATPGPVPSGPSEEGSLSRTRSDPTLRVDVSKVDQLLDLVGELIIASTAVRHLPAEPPDEETRGRASAQLDRVVRSLQDLAMSLRMVPVGPTFQRMVRVVRDVSQRVGKSIELQVEGEETEIDKTVAELITDPLVHLVRNAIDHGIESPDARSAAGKPRTGRIRLVGSHVGGEVWIRIEDDGRGLDRDRILARAVERGLVEPAAAATLPDADVFAFIFEPGFSTAAEVTDVSGRGVGMDVVRRNLELVKGRVDIRSVPGAGASFTLRIPLTLAIIEGMLVRVGSATFTVPLLCIRESVVVRPQDVTVLSTWQEMVRIRGELIPVLRMHRLYDIPADRTELHEGMLVVVEDGGQPLCLFVDELIGQRQTVIKSISGYLGTVRGIAGCTVLGDGRISLILDVPALVHIETD